MNKVILRAVSVIGLFIFTGASANAQTTISYIEKKSGWQSCTSCAGTNGTGPSVPHSMTQNVSSPTMGSGSAKYWIGGSSSYANALWWNTLGQGVGAKNFELDFYFYMTNPSASQAVEYDAVETSGGRHLTFASQCEIHHHTYRVWSNVSHWVDTGIACSTPTAYSWHHIVADFQRNSSGNANFVSVTIDGAKHYINLTEPGKSASGNTTDVSFQMDETLSATSYSTWVEKFNLKYW